MAETIKSDKNRITKIAEHGGFEFDYSHNVIYFDGTVIHLTPHEASILSVLLSNRARPTPSDTLKQRVYGADEPNTAAGSIRVAIHSLRKKLQPTGMTIRVEPKVGYEIDASHIPELNLRLSDKILLALNIARANEEHEISRLLQTALEIAESRRRQYHP